MCIGGEELKAYINNALCPGLSCVSIPIIVSQVLSLRYSACWVNDPNVSASGSSQTVSLGYRQLTQSIRSQVEHKA
jgi:hypothetical protein